MNCLSKKEWSDWRPTATLPDCLTSAISGESMTVDESCQIVENQIS